MKIRIVLSTLVVGLGCTALSIAQENFGQEFVALKAQYEARVKSEVQQPFEVASADLNVKYVASLDRLLEAAQRSGKLEEAVALKAEQQLIGSGGALPAVDDAKLPASLKQQREAYRTALARMEADRDKRLQPLQVGFARSLEPIISRLTKDGKLTEAVALKEYREGLNAAGAGGGTSRGGATALLKTIATAEDLVRKPWKRKWDRGTADWTFSRDKTVLASGGYKGTWSIRGKIMRADFGTSWADYSLEIERNGSDIVIKEVDSNAGKRSDVTLTQSGE